MSEQIEGVPAGWRLVRIGVPRPGVDWVINHEQSPTVCAVVTLCENWPIIEKIEQPKQFRQFANAAEFNPYRDRWWRYKDDHPTFSRPPVSYSDSGHYGYDWDYGFTRKVFDDGTPFGVEVTE